MQEQISVTGRFSTPHGAKYLAQLCKHFGHKVPAEIDPDGSKGRVTFAMGEARMHADDAALFVTLTGADQAAIDQLQEVIDSHLQRFAFRETFTGIGWGAAA